MLCSCSTHEYGSALARPVTVRSTGAVPSTVAAMMRGENESERWQQAEYLALAQSGDVIGAENYYQHAEHYFRSMSSDRETK
jgi:hypothetical protein